MFYGVDLHSDNFKAAVLSKEDNTPKIFRCSFSSEQNVQEFLYRLSLDDYIVLEASTNSFWFYELVKDKVKQCLVVDPWQIALICQSHFKTDKRDAIHLVKLLKYSIITGEPLPVVYIPPKDVQEIRGLFTTYNLLKRQITMDKNRVHSLLKQNGINVTKRILCRANSRENIMKLEMREVVRLEIEVLFNQIDQTEESQERIKKEILKKGHCFEKEIRLLMSIKGISPFMAVGIMSDVVDIHRFGNVKKFCSYLRAAPKVDSSNKTTKIGRINKHSRKISIELLIQSIEHFKSCEKFDRFYQKKKVGKSAGKTRIALVRKVMVTIYFMLLREQLFYYLDQKNYNNKLLEYERVLRKVA
jgi:transposase